MNKKFVSRVLAGLDVPSMKIFSCPNCEFGTLEPDRNSFRNPYSKESLDNQDHEDWDPEWDYGNFHGQLHCDEDCGTTVVVTGEWKCEMREKDPESGWYRPDYYFYPKLFMPPVKVFERPDATLTNEIEKAIIEAESIYWLNPDAASVKLRRVVEELLTHLEKKKIVTKIQTTEFVSLHSRLGKLAEPYPKEAELLEAVKWVGNEGTHDSGLTHAQVLESSDFLMHALERIFDSDRINAARKINSKNQRQRKGKARK